MGEGGVSCVKYIVFVCNLLFALTGLLILTIGAIVQTNYHHYSNFVGENIWTAPVILIVVGAAVFIIGFLGCCGAVKENSCMILTFSIIIGLIFLAEIGVGIAGYVKHGELQGILEEQFNLTMKEYADPKRNDIHDAWKILQTELECCGIKTPKDWTERNMTIPQSCCVHFEVSNNECTPTNAHPDGCLSKLLALLDSKALILGGVVLTVALVQILCICFGCFRFC